MQKSIRIDNEDYEIMKRIKNETILKSSTTILKFALNIFIQSAVYETLKTSFNIKEDEEKGEEND